jgi:hypothetical protein
VVLAAREAMWLEAILTQEDFVAVRVTAEALSFVVSFKLDFVRQP